jgi:methylphosphotriester-DNA--protein-cysteine methyltransferase
LRCCTARLRRCKRCSKSSSRRTGQKGAWIEATCRQIQHTSSFSAATQKVRAQASTSNSCEVNECNLF